MSVGAAQRRCRLENTISGMPVLDSVAGRFVGRDPENISEAITARLFADVRCSEAILNYVSGENGVGGGGGGGGVRTVFPKFDDLVTEDKANRQEMHGTGNGR